MMDHFDIRGFAVLPDLVKPCELDALAAALAQRTGVGARDLLQESWCADLARTLATRVAASGAMPRAHVPVQCTWFEKSVDRNWLVPLHQDVAIPVAARVDHADLAGWSNKNGCWFVQPPVAVLEELVALRLHVDDCGADDGPLNVVESSHRHGRLCDDRALALRDGQGVVACPVPRGGAMLMRPLLLHASSKARGTSRRRVLHFLFGPGALPLGLAWAHATA